MGVSVDPSFLLDPSVSPPFLSLRPALAGGGGGDTGVGWETWAALSYTLEEAHQRLTPGAGRQTTECSPLSPLISPTTQIS